MQLFPLRNRRMRHLNLIRVAQKSKLFWISHAHGPTQGVACVNEYPFFFRPTTVASRSARTDTVQPRLFRIQITERVCSQLNHGYRAGHDQMFGKIDVKSAGHLHDNATSVCVRIAIDSNETSCMELQVVMSVGAPRPAHACASRLRMMFTWRSMST